MHWSDEGIVIGARRHGEAATVLETMTRVHGRHLGLVHGGRSRRLRPVLQAGNTLALAWRARLDEHLGTFSVEPSVERAAAIMASRAAAFGVQALAAELRLLPERDPHPRLYEAATILLDCFERPPLAAALLVRFEMLLLDELGVGLDLSRCAATGAASDLAYVSPRTGRAVGRQAGTAYADRLLVLPDFVTSATPDAPQEAASLEAGFRLTGFFLDRHVLGPRGLPPMTAREDFLRAVLSGMTRADADDAFRSAT